MQTKLLLTNEQAQKQKHSNFRFVHNLCHFLVSKGSIFQQLPTSIPVGVKKKISNDQEMIQSDPISCPQNQKGNN